MEDATDDTDGSVAAGLEEAGGKIGDAGAVGVGADEIALQAGDDVIGESMAVENGKTGLGDEEEAVIRCGVGDGVWNHGMEPLRNEFIGVRAEKVGVASKLPARAWRAFAGLRIARRRGIRNPTDALWSVTDWVGGVARMGECGARSRGWQGVEGKE